MSNYSFTEFPTQLRKLEILTSRGKLVSALGWTKDSWDETLFSKFSTDNLKHILYCNKLTLTEMFILICLFLIPAEGEKVRILNRFRNYREEKEETIRGKKIGFVIWGKRIKPIADKKKKNYWFRQFVGTEVKWNSSDFACKVLLVYTSHPILDQNLYPVLMQNLCDCV